MVMAVQQRTSPRLMSSCGATGDNILQPVWRQQREMGHSPLLSSVPTDNSSPRRSAAASGCH